jgi:NAD(P)-dependent dehydrogenase (short-subunit alcohol dehydrogenase family)
MTVLSGKAVIVTGAARGLGRAYADAVADAGAAVVLSDLDPAVHEIAADIRAGGGRAEAVVGSVADPRSAAEVVQACTTSFGHLDGLVNNAGLYRESPFWDEDLNGARALVDVNVMGTLTMGVLAARVMSRSGGGSIVNVTSGAATGYPLVSTYCGTKGAVLSLTYAWALDGLAAGIRVNAVAPIAATDMTTSTEHQRSTAPSAAAPESIAPVVVYLLSELSAGVTGQVLRFDGDALQVMAAPRVKPASVSAADGWTPQSIAAAVAGPLRSELEDVGAARHRLPLGSPALD